jgi:secreted trypsin-like serine protease
MLNRLFSIELYNGPKILNGRIPRRQLVTYQVGIYNRITDEKSTEGIHPVCGGAVITENYIVSAAHCFSNSNTSIYYVLLGDYNIDKNDGQQSFEVAEIKKHPSFNARGLQYLDDIALLRLSTSAKINDMIGQICLPSPSGLILCI